MGPTGNTRIVQIHPTRRCNLSCRHCYSSSSPLATDELEPELLEAALDDISAEGYDWVTFSGGEPLIYDPLGDLLNHAGKRGLKATLVTNGMLLKGERLEAIENGIEGLVISLDGKPASHDRMRNSSRAFGTMQKNLAGLRERGIGFGFLFTLTQHNLDELPWVVDFALASGARGLQVHPLEITGNAVSQLSGRSPDCLESAYAWALVERLRRQLGDRMDIQLDLAHTDAMPLDPDAFFLERSDRPLQGRLADLLSGLVIEPDGEVVPLQYGFSRRFSLGNIRQTRISRMVDRWRNRLGPELVELSRGMYESLDVSAGGRFISWYDQINRYAGQVPTLTLPSRDPARRGANAGTV